MIADVALGVILGGVVLGLFRVSITLSNSPSLVKQGHSKTLLLIGLSIVFMLLISKFY
jgi:hypothetical protein